MSERSADATAVGRVRALIAAAARIGDASDELGIQARATLAGATGLSPRGVALALECCLETSPSDAEIDALVASVRGVPGAHVVLSAGVFVAAHRAVALALAASPRVFVKPSRRDPEMVRLLSLAAPGLFEVVDVIAPRGGEHVFAYGSDETLATIARALPPGVSFEGHGSGIGVAFIDLVGVRTPELRGACRLLAEDVVLFDQRGCLSPRLVLALGSERDALRFAEALAEALAEAEHGVPLGRLSPDEVEGRVRYRDTVRFAGDVFAAGSSFVGVDVRGERLVVPPPGRNVHVMRVTDPDAVRPWSRLVAAAGVHGGPALYERVRAVLPHARLSAFGSMQRPDFDGPVDLRAHMHVPSR